MDLYEAIKSGFEEANFDKANKIIKKKREDLELLINLNGKDKILRIYVNSEYISIDDEKIKLTDLDTIYIGFGGADGKSGDDEKIFKYRASRNFRALPGLIFVINGKLDKNILIDKISKEDIEKVKQLFEYFVFSNEVYLDKMYSDDYMTILNENNNVNYNFENYPNEIPEKTWIIDDKKYGLLAILPKKYYKKYENKKYKLYESRLNNENYIDVWCNTSEYFKNKKQKRKNEPIIAILLILVGIFVVFPIVLLLFYFGIDKLFSILNLR